MAGFLTGQLSKCGGIDLVQAVVIAGVRKSERGRHSTGDAAHWFRYAAAGKIDSTVNIAAGTIQV
jgi:hypothetical protein